MAGPGDEPGPENGDGGCIEREQMPERERAGGTDGRGDLCGCGQSLILDAGDLRCWGAAASRQAAWDADEREEAVRHSPERGGASSASSRK